VTSPFEINSLVKLIETFSKLPPRLRPLYRIQKALVPILAKVGVKFHTRKLGGTQIGYFHYKIRDVKKPRRLVWIPGLGDASLSWIGIHSPLLDIYREKFDEIYSVEFPGFNGVLRDQPGFSSLDALWSAVFDLLDEWHPDFIIAHSLGGWTAARYAIDLAAGARPKTRAVGEKDSAPRKTPEMILMSPSGIFSGEEDWGYAKKVFARAKAGGYLEFQKEVMAHPRSRHIAWMQTEVDSFFQEDFLHELLDSMREDHLVTPEGLAKTTGHISFIWGEQDRLMKSKNLVTWIDALKKRSEPDHFSAILLPNMGHLIQFESPALVALLLRKILRKENLEPRNWKYIFPRWKRVE
jgi:pimeloyl-ACP methyl ester carboxylesterase